MFLSLTMMTTVVNRRGYPVCGSQIEWDGREPFEPPVYWRYFPCVAIYRGIDVQSLLQNRSSL